jgi:hypothetical protein
MKQDVDENYSAEETEQRLQKLMRGAFAGPPTQLKNIRRRDGKRRAAKSKRATPLKAK